MTNENKATLLSFLYTIYKPDDSVAVSFLPENPNATQPPHERVIGADALKLSIEQDSFDFEARRTAGLMVAITPNILKDGADRRSTENIEYLNTIFVDIDSSKLDVDALPEQPHYIFKRDETHYHLYWLLDRVKATPENIDKYKAVAKYFIAEVGGDKAVHDVARVLRMPYSYHTKGQDTSTFYQLSGGTQADTRFSLDILFDEFGKFMQVAGDAPDTPFEAASLTATETVSFLKENYRNHKRLGAGDGRSSKLYMVGVDCYKWGLDKGDALALGEWYNRSLFDVPESARTVKHQILSSYKYTRDEFGIWQDARTQATTDKQLDKVVRQFKLHNRVREAMIDYCYAGYQDKIIEMSTGQEIVKSSSFDRLVADRSGTGLKFNQVVEHGLIQSVRSIVFDPTVKSKFFKRAGKPAYNSYTAPPLYSEKIDNTTPEAAATVEHFHTHLEYLANNAVEKKMLLDYFAHLVQRPGKKVSYAFLIASKHHGVGKSLLEMLFKNMFDNKHITSIQNTQLDHGWNEFMYGTVVAFIHELYQGDNHKTANYFKTLITEPKISLVMKYANAIQIRNTVNFIMFTNHLNSIRTDEHDRRIAVIYHDKKPLDTVYYNRLVDAFSTHCKHIFKHLLDYDLSKFNPYERPQMTRGKEIMIQQSKSELDQFYEDILINEEGPFGGDLVSIDEVCNYATMHGNLKYKASPNATGRFLRNKGFEQKTYNRRLDGKRRQKNLWTKTGSKVEITEDDILKKLGLIIEIKKDGNSEY